MSEGGMLVTRLLVLPHLSQHAMCASIEKVRVNPQQKPTDQR